MTVASLVRPAWPLITIMHFNLSDNWRCPLSKWGCIVKQQGATGVCDVWWFCAISHYCVNWEIYDLYLKWRKVTQLHVQLWSSDKPPIRWQKWQDRRADSLVIYKTAKKWASFLQIEKSLLSTLQIICEIVKWRQFAWMWKTIDVENVVCDRK